MRKLKVMRKLLIGLILGSVLAWVQGCSGSSSDDDSETQTENPTEVTLNLSVSFLEESDDAFDFTLSDQPVPEGSRLIFFLHPGAIFGRLSLDSIINAPVDSDDMAEIELNESIFAGDSIPETLSLEASDNGFTIDPPDTRLGTLVPLLSDQPIFGNVVGLYDASSGQQFSIAYFDRASNLSANLIGSNTEDPVSNFQISIPEEGFYAIGRSEPQNVNGILVSNRRVIEMPDEALFFIRPSP